MRRPNRPLLIPVLALMLALSLSCARRPSMPTVNVGYDRLQAEFADVDDSALAGRHVMLDPGHGGAFPGVVGRDGLSEADANLGVALYLRDLLEAAGARVTMTRSDDSDLLTPADSSLSSDLAARVALCDSLQPDVFVSLHHNSNAELDRERNETQTYYPVGRGGADQDLARAVHKHLARNLGIRPARIMAGNFHVLRNATVPAVLGEPSMLSNPGVEARLLQEGSRRLEAQAYFLGLAEYFAGGQPAWRKHDPVIWSRGRASWRFAPGPGGPALDPGSIVLTVDGDPAPHDVDAEGRIVSWAPASPPSGGRHVVELFGRNLAGRATSMFADTLESPFLEPWLDLVITAEHVATLPRNALIAWRSSGLGGKPAPLLEDVRLGDRVLGERGATSGALLVPAELAVSGEFELTAASAPVSTRTALRTLQQGLRWTPIDDPGGPPWTVRLHSDWPGPDGLIAPLDRSLPWLPVGDDSLIWLERPGWRPLLRLGGESVEDLRWEPLWPSLHGRTVVIDPAGGAADDQGVCPLGTTGRELNLRLAERLAALLRGAGATVVMTRTDVHRLPDQEKVLLANRTGADLFLTIARPTDDHGPGLYHHHGSRNGERWARLCDAALHHVTAATPIAPSYAYLLRHTAPPALRLVLRLPHRERGEERALNPAVQQALALALLRGVVAYFEGDEDLPAGRNPRTLMVDHGQDLPGMDDVDMVRIDGNLLWVNGDVSDTGYAPPAADRVLLEVRKGDAWRLIEWNVVADTLRELMSSGVEGIDAGER